MTYFTKYNTLQVNPCHCKWQNSTPFYNWVVFHCVCMCVCVCVCDFQVSLVKNPSANVWVIRDMGSIPRSGRSPTWRHGNPLWYSCLENLMERGAWWAPVHRVTKSQTQLKWLSMHSCIYMYTHTHTCTHMYITSSFICWWTLCCFHILVTVNNTDMKIRMLISFWVRIFIVFSYISRSRIVGSHGNSSFSLRGPPSCCFHSGCTILHCQQCTRYPLCGLLFKKQKYFLLDVGKRDNKNREWWEKEYKIGMAVKDYILLTNFRDWCM